MRELTSSGEMEKIKKRDKKVTQTKKNKSVTD